MAKKRSRKRENGGGSVFRTGGKWYARITTPVRVQRVANSREHALMLLRQLQAEYAEPLPIVTERWTVREMLESWLVIVQRERAKATHANYLTTITKHVLPYLGRIYAGKLNAGQVDDWLATLHDEQVGARTRQNAYAILNACFESYVSKRLIRENPLSYVDRPRCERETIQPFTLEEVAAITSSAEGHRIGTAIDFAFLTGLRVGELLGLMWSDWNEAEGTLRIQRQASEVAGHIELKKPKSKSGIRTLTIDDAMRDVLLERKRVALAEGLVSCPLVFPGRDGHAMARSNFTSRAWSTALKRAKVKHRGFHHVRHTTVVLMLGAGVDVTTVSYWIGHAKVSTTMDTYSHYLPERGAKAAAAITSAIRKNG